MRVHRRLLLMTFEPRLLRRGRQHVPARLHGFESHPIASAGAVGSLPMLLTFRRHAHNDVVLVSREMRACGSDALNDDIALHGLPIPRSCFLL